mgnify:CR=1 FL=1
MTQPPTDPGCPIFGEDGKVLTDSDGRVLSRDFVPRSPVSTQINGSVLKGYINTNFKVWQVALSWILKLSSVVATVYLATVWVAAPRFREEVRELDAPLSIRMELSEKRMDRHELEIAVKSSAYYTKEEINRELNRLEIQINGLRGRLDAMGHK